MARPMPNNRIELDPIDFITVGTVGPKGRRQFHLQAGSGSQVVSLVIEKEQARALGEALREMLDDLNKRRGEALSSDAVDLSRINMDLREPIEPQFRVAQMGLGYDEDRDLIVLVAQELVVTDTPEDEEGGELTNPAPEPEPEPEEGEPGVVRVWASRQQMRALSIHALEVVAQGRVDPRSNGRILYYWT